MLSGVLKAFLGMAPTACSANPVQVSPFVDDSYGMGIQPLGQVFNDGKALLHGGGTVRLSSALYYEITCLTILRR